MPDLSDYLADIELALVSSGIIAEYHIVRSWANTDDGYIRLRANLDHFPHHIHVGDEETVRPGSSIGLIDLLKILEEEIAHS